MKSILKCGLALALAGLAAAPLTAAADSEDAFCEVRKHGDKAKKASGYCTLSQRQGFVGIRLASGENYDLEPGKKAGRFHDQDGNGVEQKIKQDGSHVYTWEHKKITVYFDRTEGQYH
jgi:hypothetical protein